MTSGRKAKQQRRAELAVAELTSIAEDPTASEDVRAKAASELLRRAHPLGPAVAALENYQRQLKIQMLRMIEEHRNKPTNQEEA